MTAALFLGFVRITALFVVALIYRYIHDQVAFRVLAGLVLWFLYAGIMAHFGVTGNPDLRPPSTVFIALSVPLFLILFLVRLSVIARGLLAVPLWVILGTQCFRVSVEIVTFCKWPINVSTLSELLRKAAAGSEDEAGAEQVG